MSKDNVSFAESVSKTLAQGEEDAETLWASIADEFARAGPEAASEYLDAERQGLVERVRRFLGDVEGRIDG